MYASKYSLPFRDANDESDPFDISRHLDEEIRTGQLHLNLSDAGWPSDIQRGLSRLSPLLSALFVLYIVGIATAGLNILTAPVTLLRQSSHLSYFCKVSTLLSFLSLLTASIIITFVQLESVDLINAYGNDIGVYAYGGGKYMVFTWVAVMFMLLGAAAELLGDKISSWNESGTSLGYAKGVYSTRL